MDRKLEEAARNPYVRLLAALIALFLFGWTVYGLRGVLTPVLLSFLIAYLLDPIVDRFESRGINRTVAILIMMVVLFLGSTLFLFLIALAVRDFGDVIKTDLPNWLEHTVVPWLNSAALPWISSTFEINLVGEGQEDHLTGMIHELRGHLTGFVPRLAGPVRAILTSALSGTLALVAWTANIVLIPLFSFYLLRDFDIIIARLKELLPKQYIDEVTSVFSEIDETISAFVRGQLLVMLILGLLYGIGLTIAKVKLGFGIGLLAGLLSVIPYLGFFAGVAMALTLSLVGGDNIWWNLIGTGITFGVVQALEGTVITPKIVGDKVGLHPVWVIVALMVGAQVLGVLGMLLAIPVAAILRIIVKRGLVRYRESHFFKRVRTTTEKTVEDDEQNDDEQDGDEQLIDELLKDERSEDIVENENVPSEDEQQTGDSTPEEASAAAIEAEPEGTPPSPTKSNEGADSD